MSEQKLLYVGCPTGTLSTYTVIVDPSNGITFGFCVSAQPKLMYALLEAVPPWPGVSMVPKGFVACALSTLMVRVPRSRIVPDLLCAMACRLYAPLPGPPVPPLLLGRKLVSRR